MDRQVDFYLLESSDESSRMITLCRLVEKVQKMGHRILVLTVNSKQSELLDSLMWTFSQSSFVPHAIAGSQSVDQAQIPVLIHHELSNDPPEVLINLKDDIPQTENIKRVVEIVNQDEQIKVSGRHKYRHYQNSEFSIKTHNLPA